MSDAASGAAGSVIPAGPGARPDEERQMTKLILRIIWTIVYTVLISGAGILFADCPEGARPTTEAEQQGYLANIQALKAEIPNAPEGWELQPVKTFPNAPTSVCKGSKPVAAVD